MFRSLTLMIAVVFATLISAGTSYARDWVKLGDRHVGFISDHDTVEVGKHEGRFKRLRLAVKDNDIELTSVKVIFGNGASEVLPFHERIRAGGESPAIDLKTAWKDGRFIRSIELHYHSRLNFRGEAIVEVWAQED